MMRMTGSGRRKHARQSAALVLLACLALAAAAATGSAATGSAVADSLYVSTSGSDDNDGRTVATAFATLRKALRSASPGTTVRVLPGTYVENAKVFVAGSAAEPIRVVGEGSRPVFDGQRTLRYGLWLEESEH